MNDGIGEVPISAQDGRENEEVGQHIMCRGTPVLL
jgi:hypothetical protein